MKQIPVKNIAPGHSKETVMGRFSIRDIAQLLQGKDLVHLLHRHDFNFILFLKKGSGIHVIDFIKYELTNNSLFFLRPGQVHQLYLKSSCKGFLLEFDPSFYIAKNSISELRWKKVTGTNCYLLHKAVALKVGTLLENIQHEFAAKEDGYLEAIKANLDLLFLETARLNRESSMQAVHGNPYSQDRFDELKNLLESKISTTKNVSEYAALMNMSAYQLNSVSKAAVGKTVSDLVTDQVILESKRYLLATSHQVKDIADILGYEDVSYFIRFFRKHTGHSPESFRKNFK